MKSIKFSLIISLITLSSVEAFACGEPWYLPGEYFMYRAYNPSHESSYSTSERNCLAWQELTSKDIPLNHISDFVYHATVEEIEALYDSENIETDNRFAAWIAKNDREALDFLYLAKVNSDIRLEYNSKWYYPTMDIDSPLTLEEIVETSLAHTSPRLRDRYLLQAVRALFTLQRYQECIDLWKNEISKLPEDNVIRQLSRQYIAGSMWRFKETNQEALYLFVELGDNESVAYCLGKHSSKLTSMDIIEIIYANSPNHPSIAKKLQHDINDIEDYGYSGSYSSSILTDKEYFDRLLAIATDAISNPEVKDKAFWYYTIAFILQYNSSEYLALECLDAGMKAPGSDYIKESMKVLKIYLDAKTMTYNQEYEELLLTQIQWFADKITNNITPEVKKTTIEDYYTLNSSRSYYYWNDMLRRILIAEVCPRMIQAGKPTRALQLANMADNFLIQHVGRRVTYHHFNKQYDDYTYVGKTEAFPINEFRYNDKLKNDMDYCNHFFIMADTIEVNTLASYYKTTKNPKTQLDKLTNRHSYINEEYLCDLIGTKYLRQASYAEAEKYLSRLTPQFDGHLNVALVHNPFAPRHDNTHVKPIKDFRYKFAAEMTALEQTIAQEKNPDKRAKAIYKYACGMWHSHTGCLYLTQYSSGYPEAAIHLKGAFSNKSQRDYALKKAEELFDLAIKTAQSPELKAEMLYELCNYKTIAKKFPDTQKGRLVRGKCDRLIDYHKATSAYNEGR